VSALAVAPLEPAAPGRRSDGTTWERRRSRFRLLTPTTSLSGNGLPTELLNAWDRALAASVGALDAVEDMNVYGDAELRRCLRRLRDERRWLARLREMKTYGRLPPLCAHPQKSVRGIGSVPDAIGGPTEDDRFSNFGGVP
jgi:hypothetical protein